MKGISGHLFIKMSPCKIRLIAIFLNTNRYHYIRLPLHGQGSWVYNPNLLKMHFVLVVIDQSHKSHSAPGPCPTMYHSEQKCAHFCSEWCIVGYGTAALWDLWIRAIECNLVIIFGSNNQSCTCLNRTALRKRARLGIHSIITFQIKQNIFIGELDHEL